MQVGGDAVALIRQPATLRQASAPCDPTHGAHHPGGAGGVALSRAGLCCERTMMNFQDLGLHEALTRALTDAGYTTPTPIQEQAIPQVLRGL